MIRFTVIGSPVSKSNSYRIAGRRLIKTAACRAWEDHIRACALKAPGCPQVPSSKSISVSIYVYFPNARRRDLDNVWKSLLDAMNGIIYLDDHQIIELHAYKDVDKTNPRIEIELKEI